MSSYAESVWRRTQYFNFHDFQFAVLHLISHTLRRWEVSFSNPCAGSFPDQPIRMRIGSAERRRTRVPFHRAGSIRCICCMIWT